MNLQFFERLYGDPDFCRQLGRMTMASGRFESDLRIYLELSGVEVSHQEGLGQLIAKLENNAMLSENGVQVLRTLKTQRNYLTHSLYDLFSERVDETLLPREELVPGDVATFTEKASELEQNLTDLIDIVERRIEAVRDSNRDQAIDTADLLFRP